jgi:hypothetical protein
VTTRKAFKNVEALFRYKHPENKHAAIIYSEENNTKRIKSN